MKITIMRGLPGSGKTTWLETRSGILTARIFSADAFHMVDGEYRYDPKNAGKAHSGCLLDYALALTEVKAHHREIAVDNTNTTIVELAPYVRLAEAFGLEYRIVYLMCSIETAIKRNTHGVPANTILTMHKNLLTEIVPAYWHQEVICEGEPSCSTTPKT